MCLKSKICVYLSIQQYKMCVNVSYSQFKEDINHEYALSIKKSITINLFYLG